MERFIRRRIRRIFEWRAILDYTRRFNYKVKINQEVNACGGPMMGGYSTLDKTNDAFIKTSHIMAKLKEQVNFLSSCVHKELLPGSTKYHGNIVTDMIEKILEYCDPFLYAPARHLKTGVEIDVNIVSDLLSFTEIGNEMFTKFVEEE